MAGMNKHPEKKAVPSARPALTFKLACKLACALFAGLGLAFYIYLSSGLFQSHVLGQINARIPGTLSWERLSFSVSPSLDLSLIECHLSGRQLVLTNSEGDPVVRIPGFDITMDCAGLLRGKLRFFSIEITDPILNLDFPAHGRDSLTSALVHETSSNSSASSELPFALSMGKALIRNGQLNLSLSANQAPKKALNIHQFNLALSGDLDREGLTGLDLAAEIPGIRLNATGSISRLFEAPSPDINAELRLDTRTAARALGPWLGIQAGAETVKREMDGTATLGLTVKGPLDNPEAKASLDLGPGNILGLTVTSAHLSARLENRIITLIPSTFDPGPGPFELEGRLDLSPVFPMGFTKQMAGADNLNYSLVVRHNQLPLDWVAANLPTPPKALEHLSGTLVPTLRVTGRGINPDKITAEIQADMDASDIQAPDLAMPADITLNTVALLEGQKVDIASVFLTGPGVSVTGKGKIDLSQQDPALAGSFILSAPDLSDPMGHLGLDLAGAARLSVTANGSLSRPLLTAELEASKLSAAGIRAARLLASAQVTPENLVIREAILSQNTDASGAAGRLRAEGRMGLGMTPDLALDINLQEMDLAGLMPGTEIRGSLSGHLTAGGPLAHPRIEAGITGDGLGIREISMGRLEAALTLTQNPLSQNILSVTHAELTREGARIRAEGQINLDDQTVDITIKSPELELANLPGLEGHATGRAAVGLSLSGILAEPELKGNIRTDTLKIQAFPEMTGSLSAEFYAQGPLDTPEAVTAGADLRQISLFRDGRPLVELDRANLSLEKGRLLLPPVPLRLMGRGRVILEGRLDPDGSLTASAEGSIPLSLVPDMTERVQSASGDIQLSVSAAGPVSHPDISGDITFSDLSFTVETLPTPLQKIRGTIRFTPEKLDIDQLEASLGEGQIRINGTTNLIQGEPKQFALNLEAFQLPLDIPDTLGLSLNSRLTFAGTPEKSQLSGTVDLLEGRYYKNLELNLKDLAPRKTRQISSAVPAPGPEFLKTMALNIHVRSREPLLVDNNLAHLTVSPDLTVRGTARTPILAGRTRVDEGTILFQKAEFDVTGGTVDFVNPYKLEPEIDVTGETVIRSWAITVKVAGTPDDLRVSFSSVPSEPDADILSLITLGKTTREITSAQSGSQTAGAGAAVGILADPVGKKLKEATGLDEVDIRTDNSGEKTGVKITLGADLSRQLSVAYGMDIKDGETVQQVTTYYKLLEHLLLSGFQDTRGRFGGGLKYRLEFR